MHYLYLITNGKNGKVYVGRTIDPAGRWSNHKSQSLSQHPVQYIHRAMKKYGRDQFHFTVIAQCRMQDDANALEQELIMQYDSRNKSLGYNLTPGGKVVSGPDHPQYGVPLSEERKQFLRDLYANPKNHPQYGIAKSAEVKQKISQAVKDAHIIPWNKGTHGMCQSNSGSFQPEHIPHNLGIPNSIETRAKIAARHKGRKHSPEWIANRVKALKKLTGEQLAQIQQDNRSSRLIAIEYGITHTTVLRIKRGQY